MNKFFIAFITGIILLLIEYFIFMPKRKSEIVATLQLEATNQISSPNKLNSKIEDEEPSKTIHPSLANHEMQSREKVVSVHSLINQNIIINTERNNLILAVQGQDDRSTKLLRTQLSEKLNQINENVFPNFFKSQFYKSDHFILLKEGNHSGIIKYCKDKGICRILIGKLSYSYRNSMVGKVTMYSCDISFDFSLLNFESDIVKQDVLEVIGPGLNESNALQRGIEILSEQFITKYY